MHSIWGSMKNNNTQVLKYNKPRDQWNAVCWVWSWSHSEGSVPGAPPPGWSRSNSGFLGSASAIFNWPARDPGGEKLTLRNWLVGWTALDSPSSELSCGSDYCGLFTQPASTTCSHSTPPSSDKPSSLQIETNDLPLPRSPTAQLFVHVPVCTSMFKWSRRNSSCQERD